MDPFDRMTNEELKAMRGTSWAAVVFAVIGMVAAATFAGLYFLNYSEIKMTRESVDKSQKDHVEQVKISF